MAETGMPRVIKRTTLAAALSLAIAGAAWAQGAQISLGPTGYDADQPIEITSRELRVNQADGAATFIGDVIIGQGAMRLTADRVRVEYSENAVTGETEISVIRATGGVTIVGPAEAAEANEATYTLASGILVMSGDVLVTQGPGALSSDRLTYNMATGAGRMEGRVKTVLQTGSE